MNFTKLFCFFIRQIRAFLWNNNKALLREGQSEGEGTLRIEAEWYLIKQVWYSWYIQMNPRHTRSWIIAHCLSLLHGQVLTLLNYPKIEKKVINILMRSPQIIMDVAITVPSKIQNKLHLRRWINWPEWGRLYSSIIFVY